MFTRIALTALPLSALIAGPVAAEALPDAAPDLDRAFGIHKVVIGDAGETPPGLAPSGFDIADVALQIDDTDGRLRMGLRMADGAVGGDSDGDGDPDGGTEGEDSPRFGLGEAVQIDLDLDDDRVPDFYVLIGYDTDLDGCGLFQSREDDGLPIAGCTIPEITEASGHDLVIDIEGFDALRRAWLPADAVDLSFGVRVIADSRLDDRLADTVPDQGYVPVCPFSGAAETCDGIDEDCDGAIDESAPAPCAVPEAPEADEAGAHDGPVIPELPEMAGCSATAGDAPTPLALLGLGLLGLLGLRRSRG